MIKQIFSEPKTNPKFRNPLPDGLEEHGVLGVAVLDLLGLGRLLRLVQDRLQALRQPRPEDFVIFFVNLFFFIFVFIY